MLWGKMFDFSKGCEGGCFECCEGGCLVDVLSVVRANVSIVASADVRFCEGCKGGCFYCCDYVDVFSVAPIVLVLQVARLGALNVARAEDANYYWTLQLDNRCQRHRSVQT
jgi:hypothetical protein